MTVPKFLHNDMIMLKKDKTFKSKYNINQLKSIDDLKILKIVSARKTEIADIGE